GEYGGAGADFLSYILALEELSRGDAGVGVTVGVHTSAVTLPLLTFGTDEQRSRFSPPLSRREPIAAFAVRAFSLRSRAGRGSALSRYHRGGRPRTRARPVRPPSRTATAGASPARSS